MRPNVNGRKVRLVYAAAGASLLAVPATAIALTAGQPPSPRAAAKAAPWIVRDAFTKPVVATAKRRGCDKLFTVVMGERAANRFYTGNAAPSGHELKVLGYIERCQRNPAARGFVRGYDHRQAQVQHARVATARAATAQSHDSGWAIPASVVQCESGGQNLPPNSAGASGYYQIIPSTWQAYGGGQYASSAYRATAQEQAAVAARIWAGGAGAGQWVCAGG
jgi:Transglycosylase-like domain